MHSLGFIFFSCFSFFFFLGFLSQKLLYCFHTGNATAAAIADSASAAIDVTIAVAFLFYKGFAAVR